MLADGWVRRPYKTWITTPLIFCGVCFSRAPLPIRRLMGLHQVCVFLLSMPIKAAPTQALAALVFILAGVPVYYMTQHEEPDPVAGGIVGTSHQFVSVTMLTAFTLCTVASVRDWVDRLRTRWSGGSVWEALTAGREDRIELIDSARTARF